MKDTWTDVLLPVGSKVLSLVKIISKVLKIDLYSGDGTHFLHTESLCDSVLEILDSFRCFVC